MDGSHGFHMQQRWSAAQLEQLRKFLQPASQIPSSNSIQEVLQPANQFQPSFPGHRHQPTGTSVCNIAVTGNEPSVRGPVASSSKSSLTLPIPDGLTAVKYPAPNVNLMVFDSLTGYRFDQFTGLYYDANADLFFNKQLNILLQWNPMTNTYSMVGRASDVAAPALAQDIARLMRHKQPNVVLSASTTAPTSNPLITSSSVRDAPFKRERSLSFEEMSPDRDEEVFHHRASPNNKQPSDQRKFDVAYARERRRSLSFEEMTPERDTDDFSTASVCPRVRSPSCDRGRGSPHRDRESSRGRSPDEGRDRGRPRRDYSRSPSPRGRPRWDYSRSPSPRQRPRRDYSRSPSPRQRPRRDYSRSPSPRRSPRRGYSRSPSPRPTRSRPSPDISSYSQSYRSWSKSSPIRQLSPRRGFQLSRCPESGTRRTFGPNKIPRRHLSPEITGESKRRRTGRTSNRSSSPAHKIERKNKDDYTKRGQTSRRSRSLSRCTENRNSRRRSRSRSWTNEDLDPPPSSSQNDTPSEGSEQVQNATITEATSGSERGFSDSFIADNINRINKKNLYKPENTYGHIFPMYSVVSLFVMLTPLPYQVDQKWKDLKTLLKANLNKEGVIFHSVEIYPGDGGAPCNYCLVRFKHVEEAFRWFITHEGACELTSPDGSTCTVYMNFIHNHWKCKNCKEMNFPLRLFCYKCFWFATGNRKPPFWKSQLITEFVGISGLDCRFLSVEEVLVGLPPLDRFNVETFELLTETSGIPLGLVVFKFKEQHESAAFFRFLQKSCLNPVFINFVNRTGLGVNPIPGTLLKDFASSASTNPVAPAPTVEVPTINSVIFPNPPQIVPNNNPLLWWQHVEGYDPDGDMMKYLFEEHAEVNIKYESANAQIIIGPLPLPEVFDLMEYRDLLSSFLQSTGVSARNTEKTAICKAHHFGAPYDYAVLRFDAKSQGKEWLEKNNGKLIFYLENGSTWTAYLHYAKLNWVCECCKRFNFPIRIQCFSCYKARFSDHTPVTLMKNPTNFIGITGFQNWCATEDLLFGELNFLREIKNLTISYRREPTGVPLGICVLKSPTPAASEVLFKKLKDALVHKIAKASIQQPNRPLLTYIM